MKEDQLVHSFNNLSEFTNLIKDHRDLYRIALQFPQHLEAVISIVFNNPNEIRRLFKNHFDLLEIATQLPKYTEKLFYKILDTPEEFTRLISDNTSLRLIGKVLPEQAEIIILEVLNNINYFKRLIDDNYSFRETVIQFPKHADAILRIVLNNIDEFKHLLPNNYFDLERTAKQFPQHNKIFGWSTIEGVHNAIYKMKRQSKKEIEKNADAMTKATIKPKGLGLFDRLPSILRTKIASYTGNPLAHSKQEAFRIAENQTMITSNLFMDIQRKSNAQKDYLEDFEKETRVC